MPAANATADPSVTSLDRSEGSSTSALYRAAIGFINADYYLPIFERFEAGGSTGPQWNWAAGLCTLNWMAFRKMWLAALVYLGLWGVAAFFLVGMGQVFQFTSATQRDLWLALGFLSVVIPGFYGNAWFFATSRKEMTRALSANTTLPEACATLNQRASSRRNFIVLALLNLALVGGAAGLYLNARQTGMLPERTTSNAASNVAVGRALEAPAPMVIQSKPEPLPEAAVTPQSVPTVEPRAVPEPATVAVEPVPVPVAPADTPTPTSRFHINVGLFASDENARNAYAKLNQAGIAAYTQATESKQGKRTRVRVGPFETRAEAEAAAEKIRALKLDAVVFAQDR